MIKLTRLLIGFVNKNKDESEIRSSLSNLGAYSCILCNLLLCVVKFLIGTLSASISITADAVNNLSDCASNIVTITGTKLSNKPVDKEHPFGHGRIEYISALIVSFFIFLMSFELAKASVGKIINPTEIKYSPWFLVVLVIAIGVKFWMAYLNSKLFKLTQNLNLKALMLDSLNDCLATSSTIVALIVSKFLHFQRIDGIIGIGVSIFIFVSAIKMLFDVVSPLLGEMPSKELSERIESIILEDDIVLGVHDLIVHSYGDGKKIASADAEVLASEDIFAIHDVIDKAERKILNELGVTMCIHIDPIQPENSELSTQIKKTKQIIKDYNPAYSLHDFQKSENEGKCFVSFDLIIPFEDEENKEEIARDLTEILEESFRNTEFEINIEHSYI